MPPGSGQVLLLGSLLVAVATTLWIVTADGWGPLAVVTGCITVSIGLLVLESIALTSAVGHGAVLLALLFQTAAASVFLRTSPVDSRTIESS